MNKLNATKPDLKIVFMKHIYKTNIFYMRQCTMHLPLHRFSLKLCSATIGLKKAKIKLTVKKSQECGRKLRKKGISCSEN